MSSNGRLSETDYEQLSAYIDDMLTADERATLERRLATESLLQRELDALRDTVRLIHAAPLLKAPRNLTLTPAMVGFTQRRAFYLHPAFSRLSAIAAMLLFVFGAVALNGRSTRQSALQPVDNQAAVALGVTATTGTDLFAAQPVTDGVVAGANDALNMDTAQAVAPIVATDEAISSEQADVTSPEPMVAMAVAPPSTAAPMAAMAVAVPETTGDAANTASAVGGAAPDGATGGAALLSAAPLGTPTPAPTLSDVQRALPTASPQAQTTIVSYGAEESGGLADGNAQTQTQESQVGNVSAKAEPGDTFDAVPFLALGLGVFLLALALATTLARRRQ